MKIQTHFRICGTPLLFPYIVLLICTTAHAQEEQVCMRRSTAR